MFFFKKHRQADAKKEAQVQAIRKDMFKQVDKASKSMDKLTKLLDEENLGITGYIFYATGGEDRIEKKRKK